MMTPEILSAIEHLEGQKSRIEAALAALRAIGNPAAASSVAPSRTLPFPKPAKQPKRTAAPPQVADIDPASIQGQILGLLKKRPLSSNEVFEEMRKQHAYKSAISGIYSTLHSLKERGVLISKTDDEHDGARRYFIAGSEAVA